MTIAFLIAAALQAVQPIERPADLFDLLEGEWVCREEMRAAGPAFRRERWRSQEDGSVAGAILSAPRGADGMDPQPDARLDFSRRGRTPRLSWRTGDARPVYYRLARGTREEAVFEAVGNGTPRIIGYRLISGGRLEVMHGLADGSSRRWTHQPAGLATAVIRCDGRRP